MKGEIVCLGEKYLIARAKLNAPRGKVYTPSGKYIGRIVKIFGPVGNPYVKIRIERKWGRKVSEIVIRGDRGGRKR
jgi:rRNA processing protein Gar1